MSDVRYMDQSVPFWDFVESLEQQGARPGGRPEGRQAFGGRGRGRGGFGRRGGFGGRFGRQQPVDTEESSSDDDTPIMTPATAISEKQPLVSEKIQTTEESTDATTTDTETDTRGPRGGRGMRGGRRGGMRSMGRRGGFGPHPMMMGPHRFRPMMHHGPRGPHGMPPFALGPAGMPPHFGPHGMRPPFARHGMAPHFGPYGGRGGAYRAGASAGPRKGGLKNKKNGKNPFDVSDLSDTLAGYTSSSGNESSNNKSAKSGKKAGKKQVRKNKKLPPGANFHPLADVFNTPEAFVVHLALPGARREDIKLAWRPKRSVLVISGDVARPADEALLQNLKRTERKVGSFRRRVRLGKPGKRAKIVADRIEATLEAGILRITVPKAPKVQEAKEQEFVDVEKKDLL